MITTKINAKLPLLFINANTAKRVMTKHTIEIEGLPEDWEATKVNINNQEICGTHFAVVTAIVELKKTKPREITLVETDEDNGDIGQPQHFNISGELAINISGKKIWRIKEE